MTERTRKRLATVAAAILGLTAAAALVATKAEPADAARVAVRADPLRAGSTAGVHPEQVPEQCDTLPFWCTLYEPTNRVIQAAHCPSGNTFYYNPGDLGVPFTYLQNSCDYRIWLHGGDNQTQCFSPGTGEDVDQSTVTWFPSNLQVTVNPYNC
jgi:hypothetical protein